MGCRLHSAIKYEVEWGINSLFNWAHQHINPIIECLSEGDFWCDNMDCIEGANNLEANRENLIKNVDCIITPNKDWEGQETLDELIEDMEKDKQCDITREYLHMGLKRLIYEADARSAYIHFSWF
jgi:hypothetical protein